MHRKMPLPRGWKRRVRSSVLHILCVANPTGGTTDFSTAHLVQYTYSATAEPGHPSRHFPHVFLIR